jgi:hypothetical protein
MTQKKQCYRPADPEYFHENAVVVHIPHRVGKGHDAIELRKNPTANSNRCYLVQLNKKPPFSISHRQLVSARRFRNVAAWQLAATVRDPERWPRDVLALPEDSWRPIVERLIAALERGGAK